MSMHTMQNGGNMPDQKLDNLLNLALDATEETKPQMEKAGSYKNLILSGGFLQ